MKIPLSLKSQFLRSSVLTLFILSFLGLFLTSYIQTNRDQREAANPTFWKWDLPSGSYDIHYIERGSGPRHVVLQHGFAAHSYTWRFTIDELVRAGYHVWSMDLLGSGLSEKPQEVAYNLQLFTHQIEAFMQAKHILQACLVGNSMGGGLALAMSISFPNQVKSLILIDAFALPMKLPFYFAFAKTFGKWTKPFMGNFIVKQILKQVIYDQNKISEDQVRAYAYPLKTPGGKDAFIKTLQNFNESELVRLSSHYKDIRIPMLIIWGEKDAWMPLEYFQRVSQALPNASTAIIPACGHAPQEECPEAVNQFLLQFLNAQPW